MFPNFVRGFGDTVRLQTKSTKLDDLPWQNMIEHGTDEKKSLKGIIHQKKKLLPKSHILDINGVWYSSFWSEGLKNHLNLEDLVSRFAHRDFEAKWTWDFEARWKKQDGNRWDLKGCQRDLKGRQEMIKHWGVLSLLLRLEFPCCGPSYPILLCLKILGLPHLESPRDKFWVEI